MKDTNITIFKAKRHLIYNNVKSFIETAVKCPVNYLSWQICSIVVKCILCGCSLRFPVMSCSNHTKGCWNLPYMKDKLHHLLTVKLNKYIFNIFLGFWGSVAPVKLNEDWTLKFNTTFIWVHIRLEFLVSSLQVFILF